MSSLVQGRLGFTSNSNTLDARLDEKIDRTAVEAARRKFTPEFMNRIDKVVVFKTLRPAHLQKILDIELGIVQQRILMATGTRKFVFYCTQSVKDLLLEEGTDAKYGARHLKRAVEKNLVFPLANLVASAQVRMGDFLRVDRSPDGQMVFVKEAEGATESILMRSGGWAAGLSSLAAPSAANHINTTASSPADVR